MLRFAVLCLRPDGQHDMTKGVILSRCIVFFGALCEESLREWAVKPGLMELHRDASLCSAGITCWVMEYAVPAGN